MKFLKTAVIGSAVFGVIVFLSGLSYAQEASAVKDSPEWKVKHDVKMKILQDSATALQQTNPGLAKKLDDLIYEETNESKEGSGESKEKNEENASILTDAAKALQHTHPDLAKGLKQMIRLKEKPGPADNK
ncbi:MAG TPA: hypothetical protein VMD52_07245 [Patescibacteria group bacterium]|nr:hypothetical protein [Patescibacteria group bacterium]